MYNHTDISHVHFEPTQRCQALCPMCDRTNNPHVKNAELTIDHDSRTLNSDNAVVTDAAARRQLTVSAVTDHTTAGQLFAQQVQISGVQ